MAQTRSTGSENASSPSPEIGLSWVAYSRSLGVTEHAVIHSADLPNSVAESIRQVLDSAFPVTPVADPDDSLYYVPPSPPIYLFFPVSGEMTEAPTGRHWFFCPYRAGSGSRRYACRL